MPCLGSFCLVTAMGKVCFPTFFVQVPEVEPLRRIQWNSSAGFGGTFAPDSMEFFSRITHSRFLGLLFFHILKKPTHSKLRGISISKPNSAFAAGGKRWPPPFF
jgi:hypothetical protein